ncbi:MAG: fibronectin type III domain-containing protein [Chitinophagales bacterium]|nr:fibronectin type III domain-containing protein [Chitinophagales bacterium]
MKTYTSIIASKNSRVINSTIRLITDLLLYILLLGLLASLPISGLFAQDKWTKITDFSGIIRVDAVAFTIANKAYLGTGRQWTGNWELETSKEFWEYDPASDMWSQKADFGGKTCYAAAGFSIGTKGYLGTGIERGFLGSFGSTPQLTKDLWEYDPEVNSWIQKADFGGTARLGAIGFSIKDKGYLGTGFDGQNHNIDFWEYDPGTDTWKQKADFPGAPRHSAVGFTIGNKGYVGTGMEGNILGCSFFKDFWEYDPITDTWLQMADFGGTARAEAVGFCIGNKGYVGTGSDILTEEFLFIPTNDIWEYNPINNSWVQKSDFTSDARFQSVGFSIGEQGFLGLGASNIDDHGLYKDFRQYSPDCSESITVYPDADGDGYGDAIAPLLTIGCLPPAGYVFDNDDCNDNNPTIPNSCDGINGLDDNCDGVVDNGAGNITYYADLDHDSYGDPENQIKECTAPADYVSNSGDCNDGDAEINPGVEDVFNNLDDNCNGTIDEGFSDDTWVQKRNLRGAARSDAVAFSIGNKGYLGTGLKNFASKFCQDIWEYDPIYDSWSQKADFGGGARSKAIGFSLDDKGYLGTGYRYVDAFEIYNYKDFWEFDPVANTWTQKADFAGNSRYGAVGFNINNKGYVGTGYSYVPFGAKTYYRDFWQYEPASDSWIKKVDFGGNARLGAIGFSIGEKGYIGTGQSMSDVELNYAKDFWEYNPISDTWTQKADFALTERSYAIGFSLSGYAYVGTGINDDYFKDMWQYNPAVNEWTQQADFSGTARKGASVFTIGEKGYLGMGVNYDTYYSEYIYLRDFWQYTPASITACAIPGDDTILNISTASVLITWTPIIGVSSYKVRYKISASGTWSKISTSNTTVLIDGLSPNTKYVWQLKTICNKEAGIESDWSDKQFFTTALQKCNNVQTTVVQLYPNPVSESFTLHLQRSKGVITDYSTTDQSAAIYLLNTLGQVIYSCNEITGNGELTKVITMPATAASGWYVVRVVMSDQVMERKLLYEK